MTAKEFHTRYLPLAEKLYKAAFYILESQEEAEDAVQETFLRLWDRRDVLDGVSNPGAYAMTMLRNLCIDRVRKAGKFSAQEPPDMPSDRDCEDDIDGKMRLEKVLAAVKSLPERQREVLMLHTVEGLSYEEISERTGIGYPSLRVILSNARKKLKNLR